jgi:glucokinase
MTTEKPLFLGIEIGGSKLQVAVGAADGHLRGVWRDRVNLAAGAEGICKQVLAAVPELLADASIDRGDVDGVGVGFGGPTDDVTGSVVTSHQVAGWDGFPLATWLTDNLKVPAFVCNDADVAGLGEALHGAGCGQSPVFYVTVGSGVGGGLVIDGEIYRGVGRGAAEVGHLRLADGRTVEEVASGFGIEARSRELGLPFATTREIGEAANAGDADAIKLLREATNALAVGLTHVVTLLCPAVIVVGGGVSLVGEQYFFAPLRAEVERLTFPPFRGLTSIVPAALGEEVVLHGALALAKRGVRA